LILPDENAGTKTPYHAIASPTIRPFIPIEPGVELRLLPAPPSTQPVETPVAKPQTALATLGKPE
jgi:hypothetical protein